MPQPSPDQFGALEAQTQRTLTDFLRVDIDLGFTFLQSARTIRDPDRCKVSIENVRAVLQAIRRLQGRIKDPGECAKINNRANELESALNEFSQPG
jgi:hypothetical protein